ncbi:MAG: hypothetical protein IJ360_04455 [Clostridia bacterium]|nr:hypothetical protein [Clostridia bacterium]
MKNLKIATLLVFVIVVMIFTLTSCEFINNIFPNPNTGHTHTYNEGKCECGAEDPDYVPPHEHSYTTVVTDPTCTEKGYTTYTCACGDTYVADEVEASGHDYEATVTAPTCTEKGYTTYTCACGDTYVADEVEASGHDYEATVTAPTCTEDGYTTYTCACGDSYVDDEVPAAHTYNDDGICTACGDQISAIPVEGKGYIFGMYQGKLNKVYYLKGGMSGYYMATTDNPDEALYVFIEATEGGYYMYCYVNGVKTYINMVVSGTHVNGAYATTASTVYTIDPESKTLIANVNGEDYWFATRNDNTYTTMGPCKVSYDGFYGEFYYEHEHSFEVSEVVAPTCTGVGYTLHACACGATKKTDEIDALGHKGGEWEIESNATCEEAGKKVIKCQNEGCGEVLESEEIPALGHTYVDGKCACGAEDPDYAAHEHKYTETITAPTCTVEGVKTFTCACGDTYTEAIPVVDHIDTNLDITCDFEGCTKRILPAANSKVSLFTANHMIIVSLSSSYYVEGVIIEITDAKNGIFIIQDEAGDTILVRMPKNEAGVAYSSWTANKVVVGDTVQIYGKPARNTGSPATQSAKIESGILTILKHEHSFSEATCDKASVCACLAVGEPALGHIDENADNVCDRCPWKMNMAKSSIAIGTAEKYNGVLDAAQTFWTWSNDDFDAVIAKGTSTFTIYKTAKDYMQLKKQNTFTLVNKSGVVITSITIKASNATQLNNLVNAIGNQYTVTTNTDDLSVTIEWNKTDDFTFSNISTTTVYISGVEVIYEK